MYNYPYENNDSPVRRVLSDYGSVKGISYQTWVGLAGVHTGTRVRMVCSSPIPRSLMIAGVHCKIWYRGQPVTCNACREEGHVAAKCPNKGRCFHCHKQGHVARDCTGCPSFYGGGAWGPLPNHGFPGSEPGESTGGGPPAVEAHCVEPVSVGGSSLSGGCLSLPVPFVGAMGFGPSFVAWVDLFYHRVQSSVNVNGYVSAFFDLSRGVRQGCPLSLVPCPPCCRSSYLRFLQPTSAAMPAFLVLAFLAFPLSLRFHNMRMICPLLFPATTPSKQF